MKLTCIAPANPYRGGIAHFAVRLARELTCRNDCNFINFTRLYPNFLFPGKTQLDESADPVNFDSLRMIDSTNPISWIRTGRSVKRSGEEALIYHWWHPFFGPAYRGIGWLAGQKPIKIAICHNVIPHDKGGVWLKAVRFGLGGMDGFIVHSQTEIHDLQRLLPGSFSLKLFHPIYDIFPGEDIPKSEARQQLNLQSDDRVILYFGLIRPYKGVETLLQAMSQLNDVARLKCLVVGEIYSDKERISQMISNIPPDRIRLVDEYVPNEHVARWFRAADVVVLPYVSATQSGIVPIAYRCRRPVIVTRVGGLPDVVIEGESGFLVEPNEPAALANAIRRYFIELDSPDLNEGIKAISRQLSWDQYALELEKFIAELREKRRAG